VKRGIVLTFEAPAGYGHLVDLLKKFVAGKLFDVGFSIPVIPWPSEWCGVMLEAWGWGGFIDGM